MSEELNVWRDACDLSSYRPLPSASTPDTIAAAVIRDYGDERYQAAIADVVAMLTDWGEPLELIQRVSRIARKDDANV